MSLTQALVRATLTALLLGSAACGGANECRQDPEGCGGGLGGSCSTSDECVDEGTFCCTSIAACGSGFCTETCITNDDCSPSMDCAHGYCFFRCTVSADCAAGQTCDQGSGVCETVAP